LTLQVLSGLVVDIETKKALPGAKIRLKGTNTESVAGSSGDFITNMLIKSSKIHYLGCSKAPS